MKKQKPKGWAKFVDAQRLVECRNRYGLFGYWEQAMSSNIKEEAWLNHEKLLHAHTPIFNILVVRMSYLLSNHSI